MAIERTREGRWLGGVCAGLAPAVGVTPGVVRAAVVILGVTAGPPVPLAYLAACLLLPERAGPAGVEGAGPAGNSRFDATGVAALVAVAVGGLLVFSEAAARLPQAVVLPVLLVAAGAALVWGRTGLLPGAAGPPSATLPLRVALGVTFVLAGGVAMLAEVSDIDSIAGSLAGAAVVVAGVGFMAGPGVVRLVRKLGEERNQRIRSEERAEVAAHLHDGVLQTLALIQQRSEDGRQVRSLARRQERELRAWLYQTPAEGEPTSVGELLRSHLAGVEDQYAVRLETVVVGDVPLDPAGRALVEAGREAARNAARHGGVDTVDVYLEVEGDRLALFVRDRGRGFDPETVPPDRRGLADSVAARVRRHGGDAAVRSAPGEGTEVEVWVPRAEAAVYPDGASA